MAALCLTRQAVVDACKASQGYKTPSLNDTLYCNFKGIGSLGCGLDDYVNVKALFLEGNVLETLEGLPPLKQLKCLYVQQNCLWRISHLEQLEALDTLNVSNNQLTHLEGLSGCQNLRTLIATHNKLSSLASVQHLAECKSLMTVDLQENDISDPAVLDVFKQIPDLRCVYLKGNPVVSNMKNYRKTMIASIPTLTYLDDRPVFENERRTTEAWAQGGLEAERAMRQKLKEEEDAKNRRNHEFLTELRAKGFRERRKRMGLPEGDTDPVLDEMSDDEYVFSAEPPELVEARQRLAMYSAREGEEEPPELASTRHHLASEGRSIVDAQWVSNDQDARIYIESVKTAQRDLQADAPGHSRPQAAPSASPEKEEEGDDGSDTTPAGNPSAEASEGAFAELVEPSMAAAGADAAGAVGAVDGAGERPDQPPPLEYVGDVDIDELD